MKHLDLFSGIGGFVLAAQQVWKKEHELVGFCENNKFCQAILRKHWPGVKIYGDIRTLTTNSKGGESWESSKQKGRENTSRGNTKVDLLTGGFPCQPFSQAGKRRGTEDNRFLWPEMLRVIKEFRPTWVIGENVAGILSVVEPEGSARVALQESIFGGSTEEVRDYNTVTGRIDRDLREAGYETIWFVIPACGVGAPHRRDRVWIIGYSAGHRRSGEGKGSKAKKGLQSGSGKARELARRSEGSHSNAPNSNYRRSTKQKQQTTGDKQRSSTPPHSPGVGGRRSTSQERRAEEREILSKKQKGRPVRSKGEGCFSDDTNSPIKGWQGCGSKDTRRFGQFDRYGTDKRWDWQKDWIEIAQRLCGMDARISAGVDGLKLSKSKHRTERLKALGNAIVPAVAVEIMRGIKKWM